MTVLKCLVCHISIKNSKKWIAEGSGWLFKSVYGDYNNIYIYNSPAGSSCMQLPEE